MEYNNIFKEGSIGNIKLKNRVVFPAMGSILASADGEATDDVINFYTERAAGGCGLIITGITRIDSDTGASLPDQLQATEGYHSTRLKRLTDEVHKYGTKIFLQLDHPGRQTFSAYNKGNEIVAPSPIPCPIIGETPRELTEREIKKLISKFVISAAIAKGSGFDGVELHAAHGFLISQFLSPNSNHRTDHYGGSFLKRFNFLKEIILGIKEICGDNFPISVRLNGDDFIQGGFGLADAVETSIELEKLGIDVLNISSGTRESVEKSVEPASYEEGWKRYLSEEIKNNVNLPIIACNSLKKPTIANQLIEENSCDFVALGRAQLADPFWVDKVENGKDNDINICISCLDCMNQVSNGHPIRCSVNPRIGEEERYPYNKYPQVENNNPIVVIGGGPAGLKAAITLAKRNFKVILFEKNNRLGGNIYLGSYFPTRKIIADYLDRLIKEAKDLNIDIRLNSKPDIKMLKKINPFSILIASGAKYKKPDIKNISTNRKVHFIRDILEEKLKVENERIIVIGSNIRAGSIADYFAQMNNHVMLICDEQSLATEVYRPYVNDLLTRLRKKRVTILYNHKLVDFTDKGVKILDTIHNDNLEFNADKIIFGYEINKKPDNSYVDEIVDTFPDVNIIGDALNVSSLSSAITQGFKIGYKL